MHSKNSDPTIGCAILTYQGERCVKQCLLPLISSPLKPKILVVDSSSSDQTINIAKKYPVDIAVIKKQEFNHGNTREFARKRLRTDIVCFLTQDAELESSETLGALVAPIIKKEAAIAYARQVPRAKANFFEAFHRFYNYPEKGHIRSIDDIGIYGVYIFFCSNSCAAYSNVALDKIGGFSQVLLGEDTVAAAKFLHAGHKIAYVAHAVARHSHNYSLYEEFCRSFDTGYARKSYANLLACGEKDSKRGKNYVKTMMKELIRKKPFLIPYGALHILSKWAGYHLGSHGIYAPKWLKKTLSSQKYYWDSEAVKK